jgi:hypothetical protein
MRKMIGTHYRFGLGAYLTTLRTLITVQDILSILITSFSRPHIYKVCFVFDTYWTAIVSIGLMRKHGKQIKNWAQLLFPDNRSLRNNFIYHPCKNSYSTLTQIHTARYERTQDKTLFRLYHLSGDTKKVSLYLPLWVISFNLILLHVY